MIRFMAMVLTAFFARGNPVSTRANPTCMNMTRKAPRSTQARLMDCASCGPCCVGIVSPSPGQGGRVVACGWMAASEPDQRGEAGQDGGDDERPAYAPCEPRERAAASARGAVARRHGRRGFQVMEQLGRALVTI